MKITFLSVRVMQVVQTGKKNFFHIFFKDTKNLRCIMQTSGKLYKSFFGVTILVKNLIVSQALKNVLHDYFLLKNDKKKYPLLSSKIK